MYPIQDESSGQARYIAQLPTREEPQVQSLYTRAPDASFGYLREHDENRDGVSPYAEAANDQTGSRGTVAGTLTGDVKLLKAIVNFWRLTSEEAGLLLGFDPGNGDLVDSIFAGIRSLHNRDSKDRITVLFRIRRNLSAMLRDANVENRWLRAPEPALSGKSPMALILEGSILTLLELDQYVATIAGR